MKKADKKGFRKVQKADKANKANKVNLASKIRKAIGTNKKRLKFNLKPKSIRGQLTAAIMALLLVFTIIIATATSFITSRTLTSNAKNSMADSVNELNHYFSLLFNQVTVQANQLAVDKNMVPKKYDLTNLENSLFNTQLKNQITTIKNLNKGISHITIITPDAIVSDTDILNPKDISGFSEWLEQLKTQSVNPWVSDYRGEVLKLKVDPNSPNKVETNSPISYVRKGVANNHYYIIDVKADIFENALATNLSKNAVAYAISPNGKVISTSGSIEVENDNYLNSIIEQANNIESNTFETKNNNETLLVSYTKSTEDDWIYVIAAPKKELLASVNSINLTIVLIAVIFTVIGVAIAILYTFNFTKDLLKLSKSMAEVEQGNLNAEVSINREDEIGLLLSKFNSMVSQLKRLISNNKNIANQVSEFSNKVAIISNENTLSANEISQTIQQISIGMSDQTVEAEKSLKSAIELTDKINNVVSAIKSITDISTQVSSLTKEGKNVAETLTETSTANKELVSNVVSEIKTLNHSAEAIYGITSMLNEISEQTKLLSLNASIEAARAGEEGRGFAVVADEIRKLAERSNKATKEINKIIEKISEQLKLTTELIIDSGRSTDSQFKAVEKSTDMFNEIDLSTEILTQNIVTISQAINNINEYKEQVINSIKSISVVSEEAAASTEEASASTEQQLASIEDLNEMTKQLSNLANQLNEEISKFKF